MAGSTLEPSHISTIMIAALFRIMGISTSLQHVRLADRMALSYDETYLPKELGEKVMADNLDTEPIFSLLEEKCNTPLVEAEYELEAVCADGTVARALRIGVGSAIFLIERTSYSIEHRPVDYEKLHYRGDQVRFVTRLARRTQSCKKAVLADEHRS